MNRKVLLLLCAAIESLLMVGITCLFLSEAISLRAFIALLILISTITSVAMVFIIKKTQNK